VWLLQLQGEQYDEVGAALRDGRLDELAVSDAERLLLDYVATLTNHAYRITDAQVDGLREAGWSDEQIAEATYDAALFNLLVRLADAFDIRPLPIMEPDGVPAAVAAAAKEGPPA
jgi:alkylhydroperoxidase family enzyme